jgi:hypothetical protein
MATTTSWIGSDNIARLADACKRQAERCRLKAEASQRRADRVFWLSMAQSWQALGQGQETSVCEQISESNAISRDKTR